MESTRLEYTTTASDAAPDDAAPDDAAPDDAAPDDAAHEGAEEPPAKRRRVSAVEVMARKALDDDGVDEVLCGYELSHGVLLCSRGSVVHFRGDAVVNAANEGCQGGGGVDGAITSAGGEALAEARAALPCLEGDAYRRCATGGAVVTIGGDLAAGHCVHAVGPNYDRLPAPASGDGEDDDEAADFARGDALLGSAYAAAMARAAAVGAKSVAFSLLSAGIFRGARSLDAVLGVAVASIAEAAYPGLERVHLVAFTPQEQKALARAAARRFENDEEEAPPTSAA